MPLGFVALFASLQSSRTADAQRRAELRIATSEATRKLATQLVSDIVIMRAAVSALDLVPTRTEPCQRMQALFASTDQTSVPFALFTSSPRPLCATRGSNFVRPTIVDGSGDVAARIVGGALEIMVRSSTGASVAAARYAAPTIAAFARPGGYGSPYQMTIDTDGTVLTIVDRDVKLLDRTDQVTMSLGLSRISLTMTATRAPFGAAEALLTFLPLLMWASAAAVGFYVVDRLLIRPLKSLRAAVASYEPGSLRLMLAETPAVEIRELESSFTAFADRLAERERELEAALTNQVKLTREVHHRVKNNLQVIASLISLHARGTTSVDAEKAYASIQRRVDALAIVHRNHFAELEANQGIEVRALLSELVANFRANAPKENGTPSFMVSCEPLCVSQDIAMPLAFLVTELAEMSLFADPRALIDIAASVDVELPGSARLELVSRALISHEPDPKAPSLRIVQGLARQLRSVLTYDRDDGRYGVKFATIAADRVA